MKDGPAEHGKQPDEPAKRVRRRQHRVVNPRISLAPLTFEEALEALLKTPPPPEKRLKPKQHLPDDQETKRSV